MNLVACKDVDYLHYAVDQYKTLHEFNDSGTEHRRVQHEVSAV